MIGPGLFSITLFGHDLRTHIKRQRKVCKCCFQLATRTLDYAKYRDCHGYPKYYERLTSNNDQIKNFTLDELYESSLEGVSKACSDS